jgi:purine nucleoside phosphorylase
MRVLALSAVTNVAKPDALVETTATGVIDIAQLAEPKLNAIVMTIVDNINRE